MRNNSGVCRYTEYFQNTNFSYSIVYTEYCTSQRVVESEYLHYIFNVAPCIL